eukprot:scaffold19029_cov119-Isochrysis_galbana.AAC.1
MPSSGAWLDVVPDNTSRTEERYLYFEVRDRPSTPPRPPPSPCRPHRPTVSPSVPPASQPWTALDIA